MCSTDERLDGKVALVTGGNSGMGLETAKDLAYRGARVIIASRNETKLVEARDHIRATTGNNDVDYKVFDLESLSSVRQLASSISQEPRLNILINNAGTYGLPDHITEDGLNAMMQVNFFSHFLLTFLLFPLLRASAPSRIINSSAITMYFGSIDFDHWNDIGRYSAIATSGNAKLAEALITAEWDRRINGTNVTANSFDPFIVKDTNIARNLPKEMQFAGNAFLDTLGRSRQQVGKEIAFYAYAPELMRISGRHFKFCGLWPRHWLANDRKLGIRMWEETKKAVKITPEEDWENKKLL